ncbi:DNA gyrase inhibitor YacG [Parendozoicomonas sp. Alg238-R29]|uniref:DNA gyrase inhibitor YacG n=1 Tax=Parendozoicomonas sp. Alg238-R29 TaxID=2993446 RepID=UPI00248E01DD|nr:DNA gyrase inhibitor YacG [Parendozoicomonas sp. Alg238-R29]
MTTTVKCPQCQKQVEWKPDNKYRPFCCERCRLIDLGAWAAEEHKIPGTPQYDDLMSENLNDLNS